MERQFIQRTWATSLSRSGVSQRRSEAPRLGCPNVAEDDSERVELYTDGACLPNPGRGGWAAIIVSGLEERVLFGSEPTATNNRMELRAVIEGLRALREPCVITIYADSTYVINPFVKGWIKAWETRGWKKKDGQPVLNPELWQELVVEVARHEVVWEWVKGHEGHTYNERCDSLAVAASKA
jgi:ribonuclease HI